MKNDPTNPVYPISALRSTILHTQSLASSYENSPPPNPATIVDLVKNLGYVQIDTLHVVNRAHFVTLWSRLGSYEIEDFRKLIYTDGHRDLYEGWGHAASIIPLEHYRYHRWRTDPKVSFNPSFQKWLALETNRQIVDETLARIHDEGGLGVKDFENKRPKKSDWFDWRAPKMALEVLFAQGDLMIADRINFHRIYDLKERILPDWVNTTPVTPEEARYFCLEQAAIALGIFESRQLTSYAYMRATPARSIISKMIQDGVIVEIHGESMNSNQSWLVHRDNLPLLQRAADGEIKAERTTFLSPFDPLFWAQDRDQKMWGFHQLLECYKPADKRVYGYFSFPILYKEQLIGRFDPKLDRKTNTLHLNTLHLEPGFAIDEAFIYEVATAMRNFLAWHGATDLIIHESNPTVFGEQLLRAL